MRGEDESSTAAARPPKIPVTLQLGDFALDVESISNPGRWDARRRRYTGVSGTAWLSFDCVDLPSMSVDFPELGEFEYLMHALEVVTRVQNPQTEVSLAMAQRIQPGIRLGETLNLNMPMTMSNFQQMVMESRALADWLDLNPPKGQVLVGFEDVAIVRTIPRGTGRIVDGTAFYPTVSPTPKQLRLSVAGFILTVHRLELRPDGASADITALLPGGLAKQEDCTQASLILNNVAITPDCDLYITAPTTAFGPWMIGDTGLVIQGTGFTLDLSKLVSPGAWYLTWWQGLTLHSGQVSGADLVPEPSNIAYLRGQFDFTNAVLTSTGLNVYLALSQPHVFKTLHPLEYILSLEGGWLRISNSEIIGGGFGPGDIEMPHYGARSDPPTDLLKVEFSNLAVAENLDLVGEVECKGGLSVRWGELTHPGAEEIPWLIGARNGFLYLPAAPLASFCPASAGGFVNMTFYSSLDANLIQVESEGAPGVVFWDLHDLVIFSPDRPGGIANPLVLPSVDGWLRVGTQGVDGELYTYQGLSGERLGNPTRTGYVGNESFNANLFVDDKRCMVAQYATSAAYDSDVNGRLSIPDPCGIPNLAFDDLKLTSTAHMVGGNVILPVGGVKLSYWDLDLVPTGDPTQAGVISVRTGRIVFTAAGISEPIHFSMPFRLTWGEILADGNLGELFFDYNNYGQRFDKINFTPQHIMLSKYVPGSLADAYLATCGTVHFDYFGPRVINLRDARYTDGAAPYFNRYVTAPKHGEAGCPPTDLTLTATWDDLTGAELTAFNFPDIDMDYYEEVQNGFLGTGSADVSFFHSDGLDAQIEIHHDAIDIRMSSLETHDLDFGLYAQVGGMAEIAGCARIVGPLLERMSFFALLEQSAAGAGMGILSPKVGSVVEVNLTTTPNSVDFSAAGDMLFQAAGTAVDVSASVHLLHDFSRGSAEGEMIGRIDCNSVLGGLEGDGQVTWYIGPSMQYVQGRMKMYVCGWIGSGGLEGGLFVGTNVDKALAWVVKTDSEHFGVSDNILPAMLSGVFGYGRLSLSVDWYIFGGGVELYAAMGAFADTPPGEVGVWPATWSPIVPYVIGSCGIYVHGEILGGLVSASAWADLDLRGPVPIYFEGSFGLEGCALWVICASIEVTAGLNSGGFYLD